MSPMKATLCLCAFSLATLSLLTYSSGQRARDAEPETAAEPQTSAESGSPRNLDAGQDADQDADQDSEAGKRALDALFAQAGMLVDLEQQLIAAPVRIAVINDPLEYLLVSNHGAAHESLFVTEVDAELYNAAMLAIGVSPGKNVQYKEKVPGPSQEEMRAGADPYDVTLPGGDSFYIYACWKEGSETYFFRIEDLVRDIDRMRTMQRHRWVYLGSRMMTRRGTGRTVFAAAAEGNLINIAFFGAGNTLVTAGLASCSDQSIWLPNAWLLPPFQSAALLILSRSPLEVIPQNLRDQIPVVGGTQSADDEHGDGGR